MFKYILVGFLIGAAAAVPATDPVPAANQEPAVHHQEHLPAAASGTQIKSSIASHDQQQQQQNSPKTAKQLLIADLPTVKTASLVPLPYAAAPTLLTHYPYGLIALPSSAYAVEQHRYIIN